MERQAALKLQVPESVAVIGCGGVGSWTAYFLALAGVKNLWIFDIKDIAENNLNRIPVPISAIGKKKPLAMKELIESIRPDCNVIPMGHFSPEIAEGVKLHEEVTWIVVTTDTLASRKMVSKWAKDHYIQYIEAAAEGEMGTCTGEPGEWSTPEESLPGYQSVPVWVGPCIFSAGVAVAHIIHNTKIGDRVVRMGWEETRDRFMRKVQRFSMFDSEIEGEEDEQNEQEVAKIEEETEHA